MLFFTPPPLCNTSKSTPFYLFLFFFFFFVQSFPITEVVIYKNNIARFTREAQVTDN